MSAILKRSEPAPGVIHYVWYCPGCEAVHVFDERWEFNGDLERPTFEGSFLTRGGPRGSGHVCHSFVRNGRVQFLDDCSHSLHGQTMPMAPVPGWSTGEDTNETP